MGKCMIYEKNYKILDELDNNKTLQLEKKINKLGKINNYNKLPKSIRHYRSVFPNNLLDFVDLIENKNSLHELNLKYKEYIDRKNVTELEIKRFIKDNSAYHIIGSIIESGFNFGHHEAYIFPEFELSNEFKPDYLIIGKNSDGYHFVFVEMEAIYTSIVLKDETFGENTRKGIKQVEIWKEWIESNFHCLNFSNYTKIDEKLSNEFLKYKSTRIHYVVVVGRKNDFKQKFRDKIRILRDESKISVLHYDKLFDNAEIILEHGNY